MKAIWIAAVAASVLVARAEAQPASGLADLELPDLLAIEVTSVARKEQTVARTPAAVTVITSDDIRRSGVTTLPDLLRRVPGVSVAQITANTWSVTARGFGGIHANKLLVLIDGRSIYNPLSGGVSWPLQFLPLDSIEQIEVVRGPGGSLWGANAINGVINIITKSADQTPGGRLEVRAGSADRGMVGASYGGRLGSAGHYVGRVEYLNRRSPGALLSPGQRDALEVGSAGARADWRTSADRVTVTFDLREGELTYVRAAPQLTPPFRTPTTQVMDLRAGHALARWSHTHSSSVRSDLQAYYNGQTRLGGDLSDRVHVVDVEARQRRALGGRQDLVVGTGYRLSSGTVVASRVLTTLPERDREHLFTAFAQDEIALPGSVSLIPGFKTQYEEITGLEILPSMRALWSPERDHAVWAAVSRAVRTANRFDRGARYVGAILPGAGPLPVAVTMNGSTAVGNESLVAVEGGHRIRLGDVALDTTAFTGHYYDVLSSVRGAAAPGTALGAPVILAPSFLTNGYEGTTKGVETQATWTPSSRWQGSAAYSFVSVELRPRDGSTGTNEVAVNRPVPQHEWHLRTDVTPVRSLELSALLYGATKIGTAVPAYRRLDLRAAVRTSRRVDFVVGAQNLLHDDTVEFVDEAGPTSVPAGAAAFGEVVWRF